MFPTEWETQTGARRKRRAPDEPGPDRDHCPPDEPPPSDRIEDLRLPQLILRNINTSPRVPATPAELDLDAILSRVPYREILENLYGREPYARAEVPVVSRAYEEAFLREPTAGERPCVSGDLCECMFIDPCTPFVGVEFLLPGEAPPSTPHFCVLCSRKVTQKLFYDILLANKDVHGLIQRYGNLCNIPGPLARSLSLARAARLTETRLYFAPAGEYARECMLLCPQHMPLQCMPLPIMSHQRNKYRVVLNGGLKHLEQLRVRHEDFASPSTREQP
jgi:hypothetical protein